jgi:hypothetical protein
MAKARAIHRKGHYKGVKRRGQSKVHHRKGETGLWYKKAGKFHKVSPSRDKKIKAKHTRTTHEPSWRGDLYKKRM